MAHIEMSLPVESLPWACVGALRERKVWVAFTRRIYEIPLHVADLDSGEAVRANGHGGHAVRW